MAGRGPGFSRSTDIEMLRAAYAEARAAIGNQLSALEHETTSAASFMTTAGTLVGIVVAGLAILVTWSSSVPSPDALWPRASVALVVIGMGALLLLASLVLAAFAYLQKEMRSGLSAEAIDQVTSTTGVTEEQFLLAAIPSYVIGIAANQTRLYEVGRRIKWTVMTFIVGTVVVGLGAMALIAMLLTRG